MFQSLSERLERSFQILQGKDRISDINVAETIREVRTALLDADVNYQVVREFTERVRAKAEGEKVIAALDPGQVMVKIVHDELVELMGATTAQINLTGNPTVILIAGLQGSGKTTFSGKLALYLKNRHGQRPLLVAADVYRPAAIDQLGVVAKQIGVPMHSIPDSKDVVQVALSAIERAKKERLTTVIIDTAGRLAVDEEMMNEVALLKEKTQPQEILFVVDAMTGQDAVNTAKAFNDRLDFDGVVLTKLDGDTRGGAAISIRAVVQKPIKFIGTGEKMDALDQFHPDRMANRILGMGDIVTLVEKAQEQYDEEQAKRLQAKIKKNTFDFNDFLQHLGQIKRMGNIKDLIAMIPGIGKALRDVEIDNDSFKGVEAMIYSMTPYERENPDKITTSRRQRIAKGSGTSITQVNQLMKQFEEMRRMMRRMAAPGAKVAGPKRPKRAPKKRAKRR